MKTCILYCGEAKEWQLYKRTRWKYGSDLRGEKAIFAHPNHISYVPLPGGERNTEAKPMTQTETGGVVDRES